MVRNSEDAYGQLSLVLHWLMAAFIIGLLAVGLYMADLPDNAPGRMQLYNLHKSFGVLVLVLAVVRIGWILISHAPKPPAALAKWEVLTSKAAKALFYVAMIMIPVSGYMMSTLKGYPVKFFGITLPALVAKNEAAAATPHEVHEILSWILITALVLHVAGTIKHRVMDKGEADVLGRMVPMLRRD